MSTLFDPYNALAMVIGEHDYLTWEEYVFKKPIGLDADEEEGEWAQRIACTMLSIEEQMKFVENSVHYSPTEQKSELTRLKARLSEVESDIFAPKKEKLRNPNEGTKSGLRLYIRSRLEQNMKMSIDAFWSELRDHENKVIDDLIEVKDVKGSTNDSALVWIDDATGREHTMSRKSFKSAISAERAELKMTELSK